MAGNGNGKRTFVAAVPVGVLPSQYFPEVRNGKPEHRLIIAVLQNAVECIEKYRSATDRSGRRLFRDAQHWFLAGAVDWPYSFESICAELDLDACAVREHLRIAANPATAYVRDEEKMTRVNTSGQRGR